MKKLCNDNPQKLMEMEDDWSQITKEISPGYFSIIHKQTSFSKLSSREYNDTAVTQTHDGVCDDQDQVLGVKYLEILQLILIHQISIIVESLLRHISDEPLKKLEQQSNEENQGLQFIYQLTYLSHQPHQPHQPLCLLLSILQNRL